jgi:hypothetical protein
MWMIYFRACMSARLDMRRDRASLRLDDMCSTHFRSQVLWENLVLLGASARRKMRRKL